MKIAICQFEIQYLQYQENLRRAKQMIHEAAQNQAACIVFPEMSFTGFSMDTQQTALYGDAACDAVRQCAIQEQIAIGFGWVRMAANGLGENHYAFIDCNGKWILDYIKIHPFSYAQEDRFFNGGTNLPTAFLDSLSFQCAICYDLRFPELFRIHAKHICAAFVPANWPAKRSEHWRALLTARAIENQMYIIGINCVGVQDGQFYDGNSMVIAPDGTVICDCKSQEGVFYAELHPHKVRTLRKSFPALHDMRPDLYKKL
ncbi:MAG: nitrilase-related carbon-nitrogen hydrolase [Ruminococcus sp.]